VGKSEEQGGREMKKFLGIVVGISIIIIGSSLAYGIPTVVGGYNSLFFENAEVLVDVNNDGKVSRGDIFWGVFKVQNIKAPTDPSGQIGQDIWWTGKEGTTPKEITGYFATEVISTLTGVGPGGTDLIILGPVSHDPNDILDTTVGEVMRVYEDDAINFNNSTRALGLSTATDGKHIWSLGMGPSTDGDSTGGYWYTFAPITPPGPNFPVGDSYAGLNFITPTGDLFKAIDDPNEPRLLLVELWLNSEIFQVNSITDKVHFHFGSNDPAVNFPLPEPTSLLLLGSGLLGLAGLGIRRKKKTV